MPFIDWNDVYHELWLQAAQSRGTITNTGELPGASRYNTLPEWPRTTGADVIAIASLVDPILNDTPLRPGGYGITRLWQTAVIEIEAIAFPNPGIEYVYNRALWSTLLAVAAHLNTMAAPVPGDEAWEAALGALWSPAVPEHRNAVAPQRRMLTAPTFEQMWSLLRDGLAEVRESDLRDDELGGVLEVPRTTNADVIQLRGYWNRALVQLQVQVMTGAVPSPDAFEDLQQEWQAVTGHVERDAVPGKPDAIYPGNLAFWRASRALAAALDVLNEAPAPYELTTWKTPAPTPPIQPPPVSSNPRATDLSSRLSAAVDDALTGLAHLVHNTSNRLVATVGRPLLITGTTLAAVLLAIYGTARCECDCADEVETAGEAA